MGAKEIDMPIEAVPIEFQGSKPVQDVAERINQELETGTYAGHIAVTCEPSRDTGQEQIEGVVLLVDRQGQETAAS
jgi:hypothetical protein